MEFYNQIYTPLPKSQNPQLLESKPEIFSTVIIRASSVCFQKKWHRLGLLCKFGENMLDDFNKDIHKIGLA